jgi:hypothetical protein
VDTAGVSAIVTRAIPPRDLAKTSRCAEYLLGRIFWPTALMYILDRRANSLILITALRFGLIDILAPKRDNH